MKSDDPRMIAHREKMALKKAKRLGLSEGDAQKKVEADNRTPEQKEKDRAQAASIAAVALAFVASSGLHRRRK